MNSTNPLRALLLAVLPATLMLAPLALAEGTLGTAPAQQIAANLGPGKQVTQRSSETESHQCLINQLNLSPEQTAKLKTMMDESHTQSRALKSQLRTKRHALMQYLQSSNASLPQALNLNSDINNLQRQLGELRLKTFFELRAQLTPEQLQKLQHLQQQHMAQHQGHGCWHHDEESGKKPTSPEKANKKTVTSGKPPKK